MPSEQQPSTHLEILIEFAKYHLVSLIVVTIIGLVMFVHSYGSNRNKEIARQYKRMIDPIISKSFRKYDDELIFESPNIVKMYPSDRDSCLFAIISFALIPRQQIFSFLLNPIFFQLKDELVIEVPVNNENPLSLTAAIVMRKQIRKTITKKKFPDIKQLCKEYKPAQKQEEGQVNTSSKLNVPNSHCILVEKSEHVKYFLYSEKEANVWKTHGKSVKLVYISDVNKFSRYPMAVRMVINLNKDDVAPMLDWLISFIDRMAKSKMSLGERKEALKKRENLNITYE